MKERKGGPPGGRTSYRVLVDLVNTAGLLRKAGDRFFREHGLTQSQFNLLLLLRGGSPEGCTQSELCRKLLVRAANMTGLTRRLGARRLLVRESDPEDERAWRVKITPRGRQLLRRVEGAYYRAVDRILKIHTERDLERMSAQLRRTQEAIAREA